MKIRDPIAFLARPDKPVILLFGHDEDLISSRARGLVTRLLGKNPDPFLFAHVTADESKGPTAAAIVAEAAQIPLTGEKRVVRADKVGSDLAPMLDRLTGPDASQVILTAGGLPPSAALRKACEAHPQVAVIACYGLTEQSLAGTVRRRLAAHKVVLDAPGMEALISLLPLEIGLIEREIEKLSLLEGPLSRADVLATVADPANQAMDDLALAALAGNVAATHTGYLACRQSGLPPAAILEVLTRYVDRLRRVASQKQGGASQESALKNERLFFARMPAFTRALSLWSVTDLTRMAGHLTTLAGTCRRGGDRPLDALCQGAMAHLAMAAQQRRKRHRAARY